MADITSANLGQYLELYTYEYLLNLGLSTVPDSIDKRQGSIIFDAIAPAAYTIAEVAAQMRQLYLDTFVLYATGDYLDLRAAEIGLTRYEATYAVKKGYFYDTNGALMDVPVGSRYSARNNTNNLTYVVTSDVASAGEVHETGIFLLTCEVAGRVGNQYSGDLVPISTVPGLSIARIGETIISARDRETDDELRQRYIDKMNEKPFGGNVAQYKEWLRDMDGVGASQIYPIWNGGGTVKISIIDNEFDVASPEFIEIVQRAIDPQDILDDPIIRYYGGNPVNFQASVNQVSSLKVSGRTTQAGTGTPSISNPRALSGVPASPVVTVGDNNYTFTTNADLYSITVPNGNSINDEILKTNGVTYAIETHRTAIVTLTGAETWVLRSVSGAHMFMTEKLDAHVTGDSENTMSSHFLGLTEQEMMDGEQGVLIVEGATGPALAVVLEASTGISSVAAFTAWLAGKNIQVLYQLATPTITNQLGIADVTNPSGTVVVSATNGANLTIGVVDHTTTAQLGLGIAPIGHLVTVTTADQLEINVAAALVLGTGYELENVQSAVESAIEAYFQDVRSKWGVANDLNSYDVVVYQSNVIVQIISVPGVISVTSCTLNGVAGDVILIENSIEQQLPMLGEVKLDA